jgi:IS1 family transposase
MNSWPFPPNTQEVQVDEKWSFVGKKEKNCDPSEEADWFRGDQWDHVAFDPDSRLVLEVLVGKRLETNAEELLQGVKRRLGGRPPELISSDGYAAYEGAILGAFGEEVTPPPTGKPGRPAGPRIEAPDGLCYGRVKKQKSKGRVVGVETEIVSGELGAGRKISTSYLERQNATDRHRNARKGRKSYRFSKDWEVHEAMTAFTMYSYNFCWAVRTLRQKDAQGQWQQRTPAMAAGLAEHVWSLEEWLTLPAVQH